jgi:hypothetical protein
VVGQRVVSLDGVRIGSTPGDDSKLRDGDWPTQVQLGIEAVGAHTNREIVLKSIGLSDVLSAPEQRNMPPVIEKASINDARNILEAK